MRYDNGLIPLLLMSHKFEARILSTGLGLIMRDDEYLDADERRRASRLLDYDAALVVETLVSLKEGRCSLSWDAVGYQTRWFFGSMCRHIRSEREIIRLVQKALKCDAIRADDVARTEAA